MTKRRQKTKTIRSLALLASVLSCAAAWGGETDTVRTFKDHLSVAASAGYGYLIPKGDFNKEVVRSHDVGYYDVSVQWRAFEDEANPYDRALKCPAIQVGLLYGDYGRIRMQGNESEYVSGLGHEVALYGGMQYDILKRGRWNAGIAFQNGVALFTRPYNPEKNKDNEMVGSKLTVFVGFSPYVRCQLSPHWALTASCDFKHVSNGTVDRPNLGANTIGPSVGMVWSVQPQRTSMYPKWERDAKKYRDQSVLGPYLEFTAGVGINTLRDHFYMFYTKDNPRYYSFNTMLAAMWRYHQLHASGIELDYTHAEYARKTEWYDRENGYGGHRYSPHVWGLGVRHELFYRHVSLHVGVGAYLHREVGQWAAENEGHTYQSLGLRYSLPFTGDRVFLSYNVKAHNFSKADCLQFHVGYRLRYSKRGKQ